jgi:hypothetical protein
MSSEIAGRRRFFRLFERESMVLLDEMRGRPQRRMSDIPQLPEAQVAQLVPAVCRGVDILVDRQCVFARLPGSQNAMALFPTEPVNLFIFNRLNGRMSIGQISEELSESMGWTVEQSFRAVRAMFLRLVESGVCMPTNVASPVPAPAEPSVKEGKG